MFGDLFRYVPKGSESTGIIKVLRYAATILIHPGWHAVFNLRLAQALYRIHLRPLGWLVYRWNMLIFCIDIHPATRIGKGLWMPHPINIIVARDATIGSMCTLYQNVTVGGRKNPPEIGDAVMIGAGSCVLGPVRLGNGVQVGANSVVVKSFADGLCVAGLPAREVGGNVGGISRERSS